MGCSDSANRHGAVTADERGGFKAKKNPAICGGFLGGETGTRTRDTMIFSHVLYQLSYLASYGCASRTLRKILGHTVRSIKEKGPTRGPF